MKAWVGTWVDHYHFNVTDRGKPWLRDVRASSLGLFMAHADGQFEMTNERPRFTIRSWLKWLLVS